jgi:tetratricopeptide (TPR) repeat protein
MHPRAYYLLLWLTLQGLPTALPAQNLDQYDARLDYFESTGQQDSFLYYAGEKARLARQADNLALWAWILVETHDLASDDPNDALKYLDKALIQQWRAPADSAACEPFMYIQAYRGYYLSSTGRIWQAVQAYEKARAWYERYHYDDPDFEVVEMVYKPLGNHYTRLGDNEKALAVFQKALTALPPEDVAGNAGLLNNIGIAQWNRGELQASEKSYKLGLALPGLPAQLRALLHTGIARTELDEGRHTLACQNAETALRLLQKVPVADEGAQEYRIYAYLTAGMALTRTGQYAGADRYLKRAATDARSIFGAHSREAGKIEIALAALNRARGNLPEALTAANRALSAVLPGFRPRRPEENPAATLFYEENSIFEALEEKAVVAESAVPAKGRTDVADPWHSNATTWPGRPKRCCARCINTRSSKLELQQTSRTREEAAMNIARTLFEKKPDRRSTAKKRLPWPNAAKRPSCLKPCRTTSSGSGWPAATRGSVKLPPCSKARRISNASCCCTTGSVQAPQWRSENDAIRGQIAALERAIYPGLPHPGRRRRPRRYFFKYI